MQELRRQIELLIERELWREAHARLADLWRAEPKPATAAYLGGLAAALSPRLGLPRCRVFLLRSSTVEPVVPMLRAAAFVSGMDLAIEIGAYNCYAQEMLDSGSRLYGAEPDVAILAVHTRDLAPEWWDGFADLSREAVRASLDRVARTFGSLVENFRRHTRAHLVIQTLEAPPPALGILDTQQADGQAATLSTANRQLRDLCAAHPGVWLLDYNGLIARHGRARWHDERKWLTARMPFSSEALLPLANEWLKFLHCLTGKLAKALVADLDNTLWGGVLGEDGPEGIRIGTEYPGALYLALQRAILDLHRRGILLAVASKNDASDALRVLETHPGMLLRPEHFSAYRINWQDKATGLREIAAELNIGLDAVAFLDDNPVERARVRVELPEVHVIELPKEPAGFAQALRDCPVFERLALSEEDRGRAALYRSRRLQLELQQSSASLEDFYRSLEQEVTIVPVARETAARVAQLTQKTNQFNLTTRRYSEQEIAGFASTPGWRVYAVRVRDRFGDNGVVGVAITHAAGEVSEIESFLLSCRVIGRTIETAVLAFLAQRSRSEGARVLEGWFVPTPKNAPARHVYRDHGFQPAGNRDGAALWRLDLDTGRPACPPWVRLCYAGENLATEHAHA